MPTPSQRRRRQGQPGNHRRRDDGGIQQHPDLISMGHHARGFFGSAFLGAARHIIGPSQIRITTTGQSIPANRSASSRRSTTGRHGSGRIGSQAHSGQRRRSWTISEHSRPQLMFGKGDLAQVFSSLTQLWMDSPGAGVAVCRFITMHQRPSDPRAEYAVDRARNSLTRLLRYSTPNATSLASAREGLEEGRGSRDPKGLLTAQTTYLEEQYLRFVHSLSTDIGLRELAKQLIANAEALQSAGSEARQAHPRIMAADVLLQLGDITNANEQIALGFSLIGRAYPNQELVKLGTVNA